jgi:folate-binding protein YgfZ
MTEPSLAARLLANGPFVRTAAPFRVLTVSGTDAADFLQRLCSQDVLGLADGVAAPAAFLDAKGKLLVTSLVQRLAGVHWLETAAEQADRLAQLLERYHFNEKLAIGVPPAPGQCLEWIAAPATPPPAVAGGVRFAWTRRGVQFVRWHFAADAAVPVLPGAPLDMVTAAALRMAAGIVAVGADTEPSTLALEADLDDHCSTSKGCYTGQEIVARIHTYGHVNRRLCLLQLGPGPAIEAPHPLHEPEDRLAVGRVMRAVPLPDGTARVGLGYLPRDFQAAGTQLLLADGAAVEVLAWGA